MNQITIGRNPGSTIVVDSRFAKVSGNHATITINGDYVTFQDHSTNGSTVNGRYIHNSSCQLRNGDSVTLAHEYSLDTCIVFSMIGSGNSARTQRLDNHDGQYSGRYNYDYGHDSDNKGVPQCLDKWNWGAFLLNWIWGLVNDIYWPLLILVPGIGWAAGLVIAIVLGKNGNSMAWKNYSGTASEFDEKQRKWTKYGIYYVCVLFAFCFIFGLIEVAVMSTLLTY